ncbi:sigma-70 family RNA polymerase sigma factor [Exilibacterium tricleocarpae]|uniref:Sigma-70 family RNA polymerase sigma factor n=1 Tax=Exilibacterium tricleocarpae TaxID=2591008 RepID=A0A545SMH9_9GAMM|nr:ECF-type sigma factor [Exilibacterium tricleocarpae]TQV66164.1 sigma-70 family RNA polymerase sigma factor [Exilibacterium tricleocarpae]
MDEENITQRLNAHRQSHLESGQVVSHDLSEYIYRELRKIAHCQRRGWSGNNTLNTTALIHEAYLKLNSVKGSYKSRTHFFATAAKIMRQVLVNYAERSSAEKRLTNTDQAEFDDNLIAENRGTTLDELLYIDRLLKRIEDKNTRYCQIVECRVFGGMSIEETANSLQVSKSTVKRDWSLLSAWLHRELRLQQQKHPGGNLVPEQTGTSI